MEKYTKGVWTVEYLGKAVKVCTSDDLIADVNANLQGNKNDFETAQANAQLIAAAPRMYAELQYIKVYLNYLVEIGDAGKAALNMIKNIQEIETILS